MTIVSPVSVAEAKAWLRIETGGEDAMLAALLRAATEACERFTGLALVARDVEEIVPARPTWTRLALAPVSSITSVTGLPANGASFALPVDSYALDIDARGDGFVRVSNPGTAGRVRVDYRAGLAVEWSGVPEALRHGILRLTARLFETRASEADALPSAISALWRPYRRMRLQ